MFIRLVGPILALASMCACTGRPEGFVLRAGYREAVDAIMKYPVDTADFVITLRKQMDSLREFNDSAQAGIEMIYSENPHLQVLGIELLIWTPIEKRPREAFDKKLTNRLWRLYEHGAYAYLRELAFISCRGSDPDRAKREAEKIFEHPGVCCGWPALWSDAVDILKDDPKWIDRFVRELENNLNNGIWNGIAAYFEVEDTLLKAIGPRRAIPYMLSKLEAANIDYIEKKQVNRAADFLHYKFSIILDQRQIHEPDLREDCVRALRKWYGDNMDQILNESKPLPPITLPPVPPLKPGEGSAVK
jgi:hypothetical protein